MKRGFTLTEVLVTMAIISILAGMMVPAVWKWWESQEEQTTKERLEALKHGMVGNKSLIQNGIRTSYGFVGDNGELPFANSSSSASLSFLVNRPTSGYPHWNGPYISGFDPAVYRKDAWGHPVDYRVCVTTDGRFLSGALRSGGIDGTLGAAYDPCAASGSANFCVGDDICVPLDIAEVAPTTKIKGNLSITIGSSTTNSYYKIYVEDTGELASLSSNCLSVSPLFGNYSVSGVRLPIGNAYIYGKLQENSDCSDTSKTVVSAKNNIFLSDNISTLLYNLNLSFP